MSIKLDETYVSDFVNTWEFECLEKHIVQAHDFLHHSHTQKNNFLGWLNITENYDRDEFSQIQRTAKKIVSESDVLIVVGIGGSYLGARAVIEFLKSNYYNDLNKTKIYFVGNSMSASSLKEVLEICKDKEVSLNVISKSGTTLEPALAFRVLKKFMETKYGVENARKRIYCTTDKVNGSLKKLADQEGYETFTIPHDIGGRFSVLTAVGLLPIAVSGIDINKIMIGAKTASNDLINCNLKDNACYKYAVLRNILNRKGKEIELLVSYEPRFRMFCEWYKQLFGESEGKDGKGIFPAYAIFSTDLHSMGQFIQDGRKILFETILTVKEDIDDIKINNDPQNLDSLNFLEGKTISYINKQAFKATALAHKSGGVPSIVLELEKVDEYNLGYLIYFFEKACAISGCILGVNPFDQPGVEAYKKNMFYLLGKPGYENF